MKLKLVLILLLAQIACANTVPQTTATPTSIATPATTATPAATSATSQQTCFIVTATAVHIRAEPSANSRILGHRAHGQIITRTGSAPHWIMDAHGWSRADYFERVPCQSR